MAAHYKKMLTVAAAACLVAVPTVAVVASEREPQVAAYLTLDFGKRESLNNFHYGLRIDQDSYNARWGLAPPLLVMDMSRNGFDAYLNGLSLQGVRYQLNQAEAAGGVAGLGVAGTIAAVTVAAVTVGVVANEASDDSSSGGGGQTTGGTTTGGTTTGGTTTGGTTTGGTTTGGTTTGGSTTGGETGGTTAGGETGGTTAGGGTTTGGTPTGGGITGGLFGLRSYDTTAPDRVNDLERQRWLDGGTGHMGDLGL